MSLDSSSKYEDMKKYAKKRSKIWNFGKKIPPKLAKKVDFRKNLEFSIKKGFKICDPRISWYPFGIKNHEMRGPPVFQFQFETISTFATFWTHIMSELGGV